MLHVNAKGVDYDELRQLDTPPATPSHVPFPHYRWSTSSARPSACDPPRAGRFYKR